MKLPPIVLFAGATLLPFGLLWLEVFARGPFGLFALIVLTVVAGLVTISVRSSLAQAAYLRAPTDMGHWPCNGFWGSVILVLSLPCLLWCKGGACVPDLHPCTCIICRTDHTPQCA